MSGVLLGLWHFTLYGVIPTAAILLMMWVLSVLPLTRPLMRDIGRAHLNLWVEPLLRHIAHRPSHPPMTPEDYRRLREMEIELGWEPSASDEPPLPETSAERDVQRAMRELARAEAGRERAYREAKARHHEPSAPAGEGAPMTGPGGRWHPVSELAERDAQAAETAEHFAALARVGRESCPGFCPMCEERWIEKGRWGK